MIRNIAALGVIAALAFGFSSSPGAAPQQGKKKGGSQKNEPALKAGAQADELTNLRLEVKALQDLNTLELSNAQLKDLAAIAKESAEKPKKREPANASAEFKKTLQDLRQALIKRETDRINELQERLDDLEEKESPEFDDDVSTSSAARERASAALKIMGLKQLVAFVTDQGPTISEPAEAMAEALSDGKEMTGEEWADSRQEAANAVASVIAGANGAKHREAAKAVASLLDKYHGQTPSAEELDNEVKPLVAGRSATDLLRNAFESHLAEILSNPRMPIAIEARLKADK